MSGQRTGERGELARLGQAVVRARVEAGCALVQEFDAEMNPVWISPVGVGDLEYAPRRETHISHHIDHPFAIGIEACRGIAAARGRGLPIEIIERLHKAVGVEFDRAITLGIGDRIRKGRGGRGPPLGSADGVALCRLYRLWRSPP